MRISFDNRKTIFICSSISIAFVIVSYVASQWYYSRWDVTPHPLANDQESNLRAIQSFDTNYIGAGNPSGRSSDLIANIQTFEELIFDRPFVKYNEYDEEKLERQLNQATGDRKTELAWEIIDQFDDAHDFMIRLMELYGDEKLPFEKGSEPYRFIEKMINSYVQFVEAVDDPFMTQAFSDLDDRISEAERQRESDPQWVRMNEDYENTLEMVRRIESEIDMSSPTIDNSSANEPWVMPQENEDDSILDDEIPGGSSFDIDDFLSSIEADAIDVDKDESEEQAHPDESEDFAKSEESKDEMFSEEVIEKALNLMRKSGENDVDMDFPKPAFKGDKP